MTGFAVVDAASDVAARTMGRYLDELVARVDRGFDAAAALAEAATSLNPPYGLFVAADDETACGGLSFLDEQPAEVKRMWVAPDARGRGVASALLAFLEGLARDSGRHTVVLDTNKELTEAAVLYERRGYERIDRYNDNPYAHLWFRKVLS